MNLSFNVYNVEFFKNGFVQVGVEHDRITSTEVNLVTLAFLADNDPEYEYFFRGRKLIIDNKKKEITLHRGRGKRIICMRLKKPFRIYGADKVILTPYDITAIKKGKRVFMLSA